MKVKTFFAGLGLVYELMFSYGGYKTAKEWEGREPSFVGIKSDRAIVGELARTTCMQMSPLEHVALGTLTAQLAIGSPGYEIGRGIYHLTHK